MQETVLKLHHSHSPGLPKIGSVLFSSLHFLLSTEVGNSAFKKSSPLYYVHPIPLSLPSTNHIHRALLTLCDTLNFGEWSHVAKSYSRRQNTPFPAPPMAFISPGLLSCNSEAEIRFPEGSICKVL